MKPGWLLVVLGCAGALAAASAPAQSLGRLFFTPQERAALDARRRAGVPDRPSADDVAAPTARIDGQVLRSDGKSTVWVNGEPQPSGANAEGLRVYSGRSDPAQVSVSPRGRRDRVRLKVGETLDRGSGEVHDVVEGKLRIRRGAPESSATREAP